MDVGLLQPLEDAANTVLVAMDLASEKFGSIDEWTAYIRTFGDDVVLHLDFVAVSRKRRTASILVVGDLTDIDEFYGSLVAAIMDAVPRSREYTLLERGPAEFPVGYIRLGQDEREQ